jgi:hypothetical protein
VLDGRFAPQAITNGRCGENKVKFRGDGFSLSNDAEDGMVPELSRLRGEAFQFGNNFV